MHVQRTVQHGQVCLCHENRMFRIMLIPFGTAAGRAHRALSGSRRLVFHPLFDRHF
jgi:hypothetical protein